MTEECAVKGCHRRSVHVARVALHPSDAYAFNILPERVLERLAAGEGVSLCPDHYVWVVDLAKDLAA